MIPATFRAQLRQDDLFYYYAGKRIPLEAVTNEIVVASRAADPERASREVASRLGVQVEKITRLTEGHWLVALPSNVQAERSRSLLEAFRQDVALDFAQTAVKVVGGANAMYPLNRVGVEFRKDVPRRVIDSVIAGLGARIVREPRPDSGFKSYWLAYPSGPTARSFEIAAALATSPLVRWAHPDMISGAEPQFVPTDNLYPFQYYLKNSATLGGVAVDINVEGAWDAEPTKGCGIPSAGCLRVAVIDDGVEAKNPDFGGHVNYGYDVFGTCAACPSSPTGNLSHGTRVAGIIIGQHNGYGVAGIAPGAFVLPVRIFRPGSEGGPASELQLADGINFAWYYAEADVLSNSWGFRPGYPGNDAIDAAVNDAATLGRSGRGAIVVFSAGNDSDRRTAQIKAVGYPARLPNAIAVGAINRSGGISNYSNEGPEIALVAPSSHDVSSFDECAAVYDVVTTDLTGPFGCNQSPDGNNDYTSRFGGTSAAAPQVAGVAALLLAKEPSLSRAAVRQRLTYWADWWGYPTNQFGSGKLNAYRTLVPPTPPTVAISGPNKVRSGSTCTWTAVVSGGTPPYSYYWSSGGGYSPGSSSFTFTNMGSPFSISLTVWDAVGTSSGASLPVAISATAPLCLS